MTFRLIFISVFLGSTLIITALIFNAKRPAQETKQPKAEFVRSTGKCAACHRKETSAVVHQFERSRHAVEGINYLDCHGNRSKRITGSQSPNILLRKTVVSVIRPNMNSFSGAVTPHLLGRQLWGHKGLLMSRLRMPKPIIKVQ